jgi:hypothetical protein
MVRQQYQASNVRLGHKRRFLEVCVMSALPPKADIHRHERHVRFVPKADSCTTAKNGWKPTVVMQGL